MAGIPMSRAAGFVALGLVVGLVVGGGTIAGYGALTAAPARSGPGPTSVALPSAIPGGGTGNGGSSITPTGPLANGSAISALAGSSLQQAGTVNVKLAEATLALRAALRDPEFDTAATVTILRSVASSATFGAEVAPKIGGWAPAGDLSDELKLFYESIRDTARTGLAPSIQNAAAYRKSAADMIRALSGLTALDRQARLLAETANIELPPLPSP